MMTYSAGSSDSYHVDVTFCADYSDPLRVSSARMLNRKTYTSSCTDKFLAMCSAVSEVLASFRAQARGIRFYDVPLGDVKEELRFRCELEPFNARDANSICLKCSPFCILGHLAKEASAHLAPLLLAGFHAEG